MNINKMSKNASNIANKLYDELGINYHDIEISVANHLDFFNEHRYWDDIIGGKRVWMKVDEGDGWLEIGGPAIGGSWSLPREIWIPDWIDYNLYAKQKGDLVDIVSMDISYGYSTLLKTGVFKKNRQIISNHALWTMEEKSNSEGEKWIELHDSTNGHGYILEAGSFKKAFKRK